MSSKTKIRIKDRAISPETRVVKWFSRHTVQIQGPLIGVISPRSCTCSVHAVFHEEAQQK